MRKALALLATVGAFLILTAGVVSAQQYPGTTTTPTTEPGTETVTPTTVPSPTTTAPAPTTTDGAGVGAGGAGQLPATGGDSLPLAQLAIVLVAAGGIALLAVRRQPARVNADS